MTAKLSDRTERSTMQKAPLECYTFTLTAKIAETQVIFYNAAKKYKY